MTRQKARPLDPHLQRQSGGASSSSGATILFTIHPLPRGASGQGPGWGAVQAPSAPCHPFSRHLVTGTLSQPGHILLASATGRLPPRGPALATCTCRLQEPRTELELAVPVCAEDPAPGEHGDSGTGPRGRVPWHGISVSAKVLQRNPRDVGVYIRESCEEPTQQPWRLMPEKVAGSPAAWKHRHEVLRWKHFFSGTTLFPSTVFNCSDATHPYVDDHLLDSKSTDNES